MKNKIGKFILDTNLRPDQYGDIYSCIYLDEDHLYWYTGEKIYEYTTKEEAKIGHVNLLKHIKEYGVEFISELYDNYGNSTLYYVKDVDEVSKRIVDGKGYQNILDLILIKHKKLTIQDFRNI